MKKVSRRRFVSNSLGAAAAALGGALAIKPTDLLGGPDDGEAPGRIEPIIDIHQHTDYLGRTSADLLAHQRAMGITTTILLPSGRPVISASTHDGVSNGLQAKASGNEVCYQFAMQHPNEFLFAANEVSDLPDATTEIEKYLKLGAKLIGESKFGVECDSPEMQKIYQLADAYGVPVLMHWQHGMYNYGFERFYQMLKKYPNVNFIGHAQTWWANIDKDHKDQTILYPKTKVTPGGLTDKYLSDYPNMFGDLSAGSGLNSLLRDEEHARDFLKRHQNKLLYGSDCADVTGDVKDCDGARIIAAIRKLSPGKKVERKILFRNARKLLRITVNCLLILSLFAAAACKEQRYAGPLTPEKSLEAFKLREGFKIELFASEPHAMDPVEMVFDEGGNAFVAEMPDYPFMPEEGQGAGRIRLLQDTDGDGKIDNSIIFADSILEVTSMLPWKEGLIVTAAPHIMYLKDTDGDHRADVKEILFTGFFENNSEAQVTSLRLGVDNWIYAANNGQAGTVRFTRQPDAEPLSMGGADFRFRLDRNEFEQESGGAQFGLTMDDWGNRFITQNTLHIRQVVIPWRYVHRHPHLSSTNAVTNVSDHDLEMFQLTPPPYWRAERTRRRQIQYKEQNLDRVEYAEDHFTGCSGGTVYDGDAFPPGFYGNVFTGDVAGNLVHRDVLVPLKDRPVVVAQRDDSEKDKEFLASTDSWFRPSGFAIGPDGFLYVIDMYRQHIETPLSIPEDLKEDMDFMAGSDMGRIYRISPEGSANKSVYPDLRAKSSSELLDLLTHKSRWFRLQAQRLLLERQDTSVVPSARTLFSNHQDPRTRLHALYVLEGLNALDRNLVERAMSDQHPGVRKHGLILAERYPELLPKILVMLNDSSVHVVFQATLSVGASRDRKTVEGLAGVLARFGDEPLFRTAVLSSVAGPSVAILDPLIARHSFFSKPEAWKEPFLSEISYSIGSANDQKEITALLKILGNASMEKESAWQAAGITGLRNGLQKSMGKDDAARQTLESIKTGNADEVKDALQKLKALNEKK